MLKRLVVIAVILVFIKPAYDLGNKIYGEVKYLMDSSDFETQVISVADEGKPQSVTTKKNGTTQSAEKNAFQSAIKQEQARLPKKIKNVDDLTEAFFYYFSNWQTDFEIYYVGSTTDIKNLISKAAEQAANKDEYIKGHLSDRKIEYEYTKMEAKIKVHQKYLTNKTQEQYVNQKVSEILSTVNPNEMTDFEKIKFVNDYIVKNTEYSTNTVNASPHSAYAVLKEGKAVCQGYALLALKMLRELGIETKYVTGEVRTGGHAWNLVKVDGQWYHLDITWNDPVPDRKNMVSYQYFLINDAKLKMDHVWNEHDYPKATSTKYDFMRKMTHAIEADGYIYYSNVEDDHRLYRVNMQTGHSERISNHRAQYIVAYGDWIYFSNYSKGAYLTKIKTNGTEETILYRDEVKDLFIEDGYLYFTTPSGKKKIQL